MFVQTSTDLREAAQARWNRLLGGQGMFSSESLDGSSPPSVFVGSYGYPKLSVGPVAAHGDVDSSVLDSPEKWAGMGLEEIVRYRMRLVRGVRQIRADQSDGRYVESLQDMAMSSRCARTQMTFEKPPVASPATDGHSAPFGPVGEIKDAKFSGGGTEKKIERAYYDRDLKAGDAILDLYRNGVAVSKIQKCFSIGMFGSKRRIVPTKWSITATDAAISKWLVGRMLDEPNIETNEVYFFEHLGNLYSVVLFPHRWTYEMIEAWYSGRTLGFGSDHEDARKANTNPAIAGAYHAAQLAVAEHLYARKLQAGVLILREIRPEYSMPVGVWQVREGVRSAMAGRPEVFEDLRGAVNRACSRMSISREEWMAHGHFAKMMRQKTLSEYA